MTHLPWLHVTAAAAILAALGTDRLGRSWTDDERRRFRALLREHDYPGARLVALRFAHRLARSRERAQDLMGRVDLRLVRLGWDPAEVPLAKRLCRLVWSEWTHAVAEGEASRRAEEAFVGDLEATEGVAAASVEQWVADEETRQETLAGAQADLAKLRALFEEAGDEVNLLWLDCARTGEIDLLDLQTMARRSGRDVADFYAAAKRRKRAVRRLVAQGRGVPCEEDPR